METSGGTSAVPLPRVGLEERGTPCSMRGRGFEIGEEVWREGLRGGFEPYRVCGFAEPPSLRGTGKRLPFVERCNAGEGREAVLRNPNNFIRSATVRVTR